MLRPTVEPIFLAAADPITALLTKDYAALGGWSLFIMLSLIIVVGSFREWWVPGPRYKRMEDASIKMTDANTELRKQNGQLIDGNQIIKHFFEETIPKRGSSKE